MPVYNGSTKQKGLYYGGSKIKEAYYGSTKVYSSAPLYYCYFCHDQGDIWLYSRVKLNVNGTYNVGERLNGLSSVRVNSSSELNYFWNITITNATENTFVNNYYTYTYTPSGDLYT